MNERCAYLVRRLEDARISTQTFFENLQPADWEKQVYTEGAAWSIRQVVAHFVMAEDGMARLVAGVVEGGDGVPEDFDLDSYNEYKAKQLENNSPEILLEKFAAARQNTIDLVAGFTDGDLVKQGRHPWLGMTAIEAIIKLMYRHNKIHQREIRVVLDGV
ncbi:MAG: DinB family protein [Chloroflexi bacterium]|nr:DinB family protein [Chloroflexota bacterium]